MIGIGAGVIDEDYQGEVKVLIFNYGHQDFHIKKGD
jgi:dUTP pyrophosphatase